MAETVLAPGTVFSGSNAGVKQALKMSSHPAKKRFKISLPC